ncbi:MAG TPA: methyltransferase [Planctomycetaceae bacterium]|nr:methyltransferase [Planctomycetaceae bacterium]
MNSRQRLQATLRHEPVDRVCVDFGATAVTGMGAGAVHRLRQAVLGDQQWRVKVVEPYQMLGQFDDALRQALGLDVVGVGSPVTMFGFRNDEGWKPFVLFDGTPVLVPERFNTTSDAKGDLLIHPEGDLAAPPRGRMPHGGYFFDSIIHQEPIDEDHLDPADNCEEFAPLDPAIVRQMAGEARRLASETEYGISLALPGCAFGDIALVPAPWMKHPKGVRDVEEWYVSTIARPDYVHAVFDRQLETALETIDHLAEEVGDRADAAYVSGTDFGAQHGLFISIDAYRRLFKPYHQAVNRRIHEKTPWKTFIHSCGAVHDLIPEFIDAGFDILNPVQCSAAGMEPKTLKREFGRDIVFWGGGVDTQQTLPFGTPEEVRAQVADRVKILGSRNGYVFNTIHNIQCNNVPTENLLAMFRALADARGMETARMIP